MTKKQEPTNFFINMTIDDQTQKSKDLISYSRKRPFAATLLEITSLNKKGSTKENLHIVLDLKGSNIDYNVGSSFGVFPENSPESVEGILSLLEVPGDHIVYDKRSEGALTLEAFLRKKANLQGINSKHLRLVEKYNPSERLSEILSSKANLLAYTEKADLSIFLTDFWSLAIDVQFLLDVLCPLLPRYYSIASSQRVAGDKLDLMVAYFSYQRAGKKQESITASFLTDRCTIGTSKVLVYLMENKHFHLPQDRNTPIIMIGPGTGFAAFRGFLQERYAQNPNLNNQWLFTGDRNRKTDFHYGEELTEWEKSNFLKLNLAFSRDSKEKWYVQDEIKKNSALIWQWIQSGANIYICGDAKKMAKDVTQTLHEISISEGNLTPEEAKLFFKALKKENRLSLDIY